MSLAPAAQPDAPQRLTIRLDPAALGKVEVRVERSEHGTTRVELAVERPDTLLTLMAERSALNGALDAAGIPPEGRTVQFSLAPSDPGVGGGTAGGSGTPGNWSGSGGSAPGSGGEDGRSPPAPRRTRLHAGIDITA